MARRLLVAGGMAFAVLSAPASAHTAHNGHHWSHAASRLASRQPAGGDAQPADPNVLPDGLPRLAHFGRHRSDAPSVGYASEGFAATARDAVARRSWGMPNWLAEAERFIGTNPTHRRSLWCADFLNFVLARSGLRGTGSSMARSFASYGERIPGPRVGAIAVFARGQRGGHVGIVSGVDASGNPIVVSGNHGGRVAEAKYARSRVIAYVWPRA